MKEKDWPGNLFIALPLKPASDKPEVNQKNFLLVMEQAQTIKEWANIKEFHPLAVCPYPLEPLNKLKPELIENAKKLSEEILKRCDWMWIFPNPEYPLIPEAMQIDIETAENLGVKKYYWCLNAIDKIKNRIYFFDIFMESDKKT